jgi:type IV secretory pathway TraG/TraD family ATPase VirD4
MPSDDNFILAEIRTGHLQYIIQKVYRLNQVARLLGLIIQISIINNQKNISDKVVNETKQLDD